MNCARCKKSVFSAPLQRVNELGIDGIWWCESCIRNHEPELYKNIQEDKNQIEKDLENDLYN